MIGFNGDGLDGYGSFFLGISSADPGAGPGTLQTAGLTVAANVPYAALAPTTVCAIGPDGQYAGDLSLVAPYVMVDLADLNTTAEGKPLLGILVADIAFHCDGPGVVILNLFNSNGELRDTLTIVQEVPEPMTLGLLGLGGLFLRRRLA